MVVNRLHFVPSCHVENADQGSFSLSGFNRNALTIGANSNSTRALRNLKSCQGFGLYLVPWFGRSHVPHLDSFVLSGSHKARAIGTQAQADRIINSLVGLELA